MDEAGKVYVERVMDRLRSQGWSRIDAENEALERLQFTRDVRQADLDKMREGSEECHNRAADSIVARYTSK